jgi:uncharacterized DUF497 family protein
MTDEFEWDEAKGEANFRKHGVDFETATLVFVDPFAVGRTDESAAYGEIRLLITGMADGALLTVVYTERGEVIRIISARRATKKEHDDYYRQNAQE